ncbi:DNA binding domain protein, excisionase family [Chloroherpeton thalassium ATCC 35110]|uniref:DNA binding domain protein, excisionase family n=1 Tax=Chloroherpeton thalassium (strain ATCC 35110 / GB-78) TaxID=517418 RepID=B3QRS4_CHLT3|nr:B12-binding domain-containing protein [Chloroherpeton thalassium]ACF13877.1 DNA binding domain protein, excisionase family [Chloroherpeton thalassium ATCC 35110]
MQHYFSTRELSELCGVGETTVKRWSNMGLIKHHKTIGRHRKFKLEDVLDFISKNKITIPEEQIERLKIEKQSSDNLDLGTEILLVKGDTDALSIRLLNSLLSYNKEEIDVLLIKAFEQDLSFAAIFDKLISPAMENVGKLWESKKICVAEEHIISNLLIEAIIRLKARYEAKQDKRARHAGMGKSLVPHAGTGLKTRAPAVAENGQQAGDHAKRFGVRKAVVCTCPESEYHEIASHGVSLVCQSLGFEVIFVGSSVPFKDLLSVVNLINPDMLCMSVTVARLEVGVYRKYEQFRKALKRKNISFVVGGQFIGEKKTQPILADFKANNFQELEQYIRENFEVNEVLAI